MSDWQVLDEAQYRSLTERRVREPGSIREAALSRVRRPLADASGRLVILAADHPARAALGVGTDAFAMANRADLLDRLLVALSMPGVDGVLATADIIEDLLLLGALDGKVVIGSMNRGGLAGSAFELDDRMTGHTAADIADAGLDGGKMLLRLDFDDPATVTTLESCARSIDLLASRGLMALIEPFICHRVDGRVRNDLRPEAVVRAVAVASGLGGTSAYTWLKLPVVEEMERVVGASTLPILLLGGDLTAGRTVQAGQWRAALDLPSVRGVAVGRSLLYPLDGDVTAAVAEIVALVKDSSTSAYRDGPGVYSSAADDPLLARIAASSQAVGP